LVSWFGGLLGRLSFWSCAAKLLVVKVWRRCFDLFRDVEAASFMVGLQCSVRANKMLPQNNIQVSAVVRWAIFV